MDLTSILKYPFNQWWKPLTIFGIATIFFVVSEFSDSRTIQDIAFFLFAFGWVLTLISAIIQLTKKKWLYGIISLGIFGLTIPAFFMYSIATFWIDQSLPDEFADNLTIPLNIEIHNPLELSYINLDSFKKGKKEMTFELYNSFQPGLYEYKVWLDRIGQGTIYLKAYEITNGTALSPSRLKERSTISVQNTTDQFLMFETDDHFTIYEGDWGKPYAARFEVWFQSNNGGSGKMLLSKNYKIEGWMR